jgi:membrane protein
MTTKRKPWRIVWDAAWHTVITHDGVEHAGYLAFLGLLSLFPFLVLLVSLTGFMGEGELGKQFLAFMRDHLPSHVMQALMPRVDEIISGPSPALLTISMCAAVWTASSAVEGYRTVLNHAYHVGTPPAYIWRRLLSIAQLLIFTFCILIAMLLLLFVPIAVGWLETKLGIPHQILQWMSWDESLRPVLIGLMFGVVLLMYYVLPNIKQRLASVRPGAIVTVALWVLAVQLFRIYLTEFNQVNLIYGSLGGVIATLLFFYMLNLIFIFGAELNYQLISVGGKRVEEKQNTHTDAKHG